MDAKELRIGNWVKSKAHPETMQVTAIGRRIDLTNYVERAFISSNGYNVDVDCLLPLELTEDIFIKAGFFKARIVGTDKIVMRDSYTAFYYRDGWVMCMLYDTYAEYEEGKECSATNYVHELQNLYHFTTCKELNINLTTNNND